MDGSNVVALNNLAYTLALSDPDVALKYAQQAAELAPDSATVQDTLGWIYYRKAIFSTAVNYLETAVKKEPTPRRQFHLAMSLFEIGSSAIRVRRYSSWRCSKTLSCRKPKRDGSSADSGERAIGYCRAIT